MTESAERYATTTIVIEPGALVWCSPTSSDRHAVSVERALLLAEEAEPRQSLVTDGRRSTRLPDNAGGRRVGPGRPVLAMAADGRFEAYAARDQVWVALEEDHLRVALLVTESINESLLGSQANLTPGRQAQVVNDLMRLGVLRSSESDRSDRVPTASAAPTGEGRRAGGLDRVRRTLTQRQSSLASRRRGTADRRTPVFSFWATADGPHLGPSAVVAYARVAGGGGLNNRYDFRRVAPADEVLEALAFGSGPAVLLCGNYLWSVDENIEVVRRAVEARPQLLVVHGGPSTPRNSAECKSFLGAIPGQHVAVNGEGELTFAEVLDRLVISEELASGFDLHSLRGVAGVRFIDEATGQMISSPDRERHGALEDFPSAYTSGEFDDVDPEVLRRARLPLETNRGCPYGCTFCDWGQATMSRIRTFPLERVRADLEWMADRELEVLVIADANFGILPRDEDIVDLIVASKSSTGHPAFVSGAPPKHATERYVRILDEFLQAGIRFRVPLALQTRDSATLEAIARRNIGTDVYDDLAVELRRRGIPLVSELMMGLPGSGVETLKTDLQWCIDNQVRPMLFPTFVLPNAPMNDPDYKKTWRIETAGGMIVSTISYDSTERLRMDRLAYVYECLEYLGILRHVLRYLQWDHGLRSMDTVEAILDATSRSPDRYPLLNWFLLHADLFLIPPASWEELYEEVHHLLIEELGVPDGAELQTVIDLNAFLLPREGRVLPESLDLEFDYLAYWRDHTAWLYGLAHDEYRSLDSYGPGRIEVLEDPDDLCASGFRRTRAFDSVPSVGHRTETWFAVHFELISELSLYPPPSTAFLDAWVRLPRTRSTEVTPMSEVALTVPGTYRSRS